MKKQRASLKEYMTHWRLLEKFSLGTQIKMSRPWMRQFFSHCQSLEHFKCIRLWC